MSKPYTLWVSKEYLEVKYLTKDVGIIYATYPDVVLRMKWDKDSLASIQALFNTKKLTEPELVLLLITNQDLKEVIR